MRALNSVSNRDRAEIARSAEEARSFVFTGVDEAQVNRYQSPPPDTPYNLEYAFHLLGDLRRKTVLDLGCGKGENLVPLSRKGAHVTGIDISPDLIELARKRIATSGIEAEARVGSACDTGLPDESLDAIFCIALIHHLEIPRVRDEMLRILKKEGFVILSEPIRFSRVYDRLRTLLPPRGEISEFEHPLTKEQFASMVGPFTVEGLRYFRLPIVPLVEQAKGATSHSTRRLSAWVIHNFPATRHFATWAVARLRKLPSVSGRRR
ncbi:MAG: class I SAM-dependent methyltransferase [Candidatus Sulfotelmatobacter sp.]